MSCSCACHASSGSYKLRCTEDKHSSGVPGLPSCSPCDYDGQTSDSTVLCRLHHKKRQIAEIGLICYDHHARIRETLQDILELWALLPLYLITGGAQVADGSKRRKKPDPPAPVNLGVLALLDPRSDDEEQRVSLETHGSKFESNGDEGLPSIVLQLQVWADMVIDGRGLKDVPNQHVVESVRILQRHIDWLAADPIVTKFDAQVRTMRRYLASANGERTAKPVGKCPTLDGDGVICDGPLWPSPTFNTVDCGKCGRHIDERMLRHLGGMLSVGPETITA